MAYFERDIPFLYLRDTTFKLFVDYYPSFFGLSKSQIEQGWEIECNAIKRADKIVYSSAWAARFAINDYKADKNKIL